MGKVRPENYVTIQGWMITELNLKGNELLLYALIYGFSQAEGRFSGCLQYLREWLGCSKNTTLATLKSLVEKGLIRRFEREINNVKFVDYQCNDLTGVVQNLNRGSAESEPGVVQKLNPIYIRDIYKDTDISNNPPISPQGGKRERAKPFTPPDIDEVRAYCKDRANSIDPDEWYDFYASKGWMVGRNKMVDWKAAVRTWENKRRTAEPAAVQPPPPEEQKDYHQKMTEQTREAIKTLRQAEEMEEKRREVLREYFNRTGKSVAGFDADKP